METHFQTSFIPKKPIETSAQGPSLSSSSAPLGILFIISSIILAISVLGALVVFGYQAYLKGRITNQVAQIDSNRKAINQDEIKTISRLSDRITIAKKVLDNHIAISYLFDAIGTSTVKNVAFTSFSYAYAGPDKINVSMKGQARTYASVVNQAEAFKISPYTRDIFRNSIFSDVGKGDTGLIDFSFSTQVDVNAVSFKQNINKKNNLGLFLMSDGSRGSSTSTPIEENLEAEKPETPAASSTKPATTQQPAAGNNTAPKPTTPAAPTNNNSLNAQ